MFKKFKINTAANRLLEEQLYAQALNELEAGQIRGGLWAKALSNSSGDEQKTRGLYLKYHVQAMVDEAVVAEGLAEQRLVKVIHPQVSKEKVPQGKEKKDSLHISNYQPLRDFSKYKGIPEDKLIKMIRDGFYQGRLFDEQWYVHKSEFSS